MLSLQRQDIFDQKSGELSLVETESAMLSKEWRGKADVTP